MPHIWPSIGQMWEAGSAPLKRFELFVSFIVGGRYGKLFVTRIEAGELGGGAGTHICQKKADMGRRQGKKM